nr:Adenylyl cyclase class-3 4 guanylyl cyclase domain containing protein [Haemonchus contortus]
MPLKPSMPLNIRVTDWSVHTVLNFQLLATVVVHVWCHFLGLYLHLSVDRLTRSAFLSGRNAVEAEHAAEHQSNRLNRLLAAFLPQHLITAARLQIATNNPHIFAEHYPQVTVAYGRLIGLEAVLSQCSSLDAARVLKEFEQRIDRLCDINGCTKVASEGITVVSSIPTIDPCHALNVVRFATQLEALVSSFRDATTADVAVCIGIDSGSISAGVVGSTKWHYDVIGFTVDNAILLQSSAPKHGVFITEETRRHVENHFNLESIGDIWRVRGDTTGPELFPVNKRFSMVTVPQGINRLLQTLSTIDPHVKTIGTTKKRKAKLQDDIEEKHPSDKGSFMNSVSLQFKNIRLETEFHKEMDHWFIPALAISIFFLVVYGIYHMLVMPRLITSLALIVVALTLMFFILLMLYINYFHSFSQFITRTAHGHSLTILLIMTMLFLCGIVNTFSCPQPEQADVCQSIHFSAFSFAMWILTTAVFIRFSSVYLLGVLTFAVFIYTIQIFLTHPPIGPKEFTIEFDLWVGLSSLAALVFLHARRCEKLMRLDFLSVVKGVEESSSKDRFLLLNSQVLLNLVPPHVAPWVVAKTGEQWHHAHHSVGVAYMTISGFSLADEQGLNGLNYVFTSFDQQLSNYRGIEKIKSANRFYIVAVGLLPDAAQNVNETPWTIGELLHTLAQFLLQATQFATEKEFQVQIGMDCGSALSLVADTDQPRYELWGETVERARILMQSASHGRTLVSEEIFLALRPRNLHFSTKSMKVIQNLNAYILYSREDHSPVETMPREEQERHTKNMFEAAQNIELQMSSSMASSFSSELQSIDGGGETDSDIEWITPETALMHQSTSGYHPREPVIPLRTNYRASDYDPYREPYEADNMIAQRYSDSNKGDHVGQYSDWSEQDSRAPSRGSRGSQRGRQRRHGSSKSSLRYPFSWLKRGNSTDYDDSLADPAERLEAAANRVDRMLQELNAYGEFADIKPLEYRPFPTAFGSMKSVHRAMSSACHTEYDNAESEAALSDVETNANGRTSRSRDKKRRRRWRTRVKGDDGDSESNCSSLASSVELDPLRWKSVHSIGYENEYEMESDNEGLAIEEMKALSRDIRRNFGDFKLATFDDIDQD